MAERVFVRVLWLLLFLGLPMRLFAEDDSNPSDSASQIQPAPARTPEAFPQNPFGFFRGHGPPELLKRPRAVGFYFDSFLMIVVGLIFLLWVRTSYWISRDSAILKFSSP
ncbi:MAG: hypothetical protein KDA84_22765, partial [Planctomycetaceae bacterium]|nr:hypothetical protein [Planctomycetaceae bacterium]